MSETDVYELEFTTPQGTVERAEVTADNIAISENVLTFLSNESLVLALPMSSVVHFGQLPLVHDLVKVEGDTKDAGGQLQFVDEPYDPWAHMSGKGQS